MMVANAHALYYNVIQKGDGFMSISLRLTPEEDTLIKNYAALKNLSVSEAVRTAILEKIEDEFDLELYHTAMAEHKKNPVTYSHEDVKRRLGLN